MLTQFFSYLMLEGVIKYQMVICGIVYRMLVSVATYHISTYDIAYQMLGFDYWLSIFGIPNPNEFDYKFLAFLTLTYVATYGYNII